VTKSERTWRLGRPSHGGLYAHVRVGDRVKLLFEYELPEQHRPQAEELWLKVVANDCLGARRFAGELLSEPQQIPMSRGARVLFGQRHMLDWSSRLQPNVMGLLVDWWRRRTHQDEG